MNGLRPLDAVYMGLVTFALIGAVAATTEAATWEVLLVAACGYVLMLLVWKLWRIRGHRP